MRILLDLQGCQTPGSRSRGIGRYSMALAKALVREGSQHEFHLLLNGAFADTLEPIAAEFTGLVAPESIHVFQVPFQCADVQLQPHWRMRAAPAIRRCAIQQVQPDFLHVSSVFEGRGDDATTDIDPELDGVPASATVYDFIPYLHAKRYLAGDQMRAWYMRRLESMKRATLLMGISQSACAEARQVLGEHHGRIVNVSTAADPRMFFPAPSSGDAARRLGLHKPFVMYTGGIDWRKNIEGLVDAFAAFPPNVRERYQLAIVCHAETYATTQLSEHARRAGLSPGEMVLTGYVTDEDLADLYRSCELFVFPSLHEGFGLPALEAMMCGAPVIGSATSSIPEVIGRQDALFDPASPQAISALMRRGLEDEDFRASLKQHALVQSASFSWDRSARTALQAMEDCHAARRAPAPPVSRKPRLAMHAPLPPSQSGIADYTCELLPALREHYDIELIHKQPGVELPAGLSDVAVRSVAWFRENAKRFDRVVYQFGNSLHHAHMFDLLREIPGTVVLHDFFLGGVLNWMETLGVVPNAFCDALLRSHGAAALDYDRTAGREAAMARFPVNRFVIERAAGVIAHSQFSIDAAQRWYGEGTSAGWRRIPHLRAVPPAPDRARARRELGIADDVFLVCSFGHVGATKLNDRLLRAWNASSLGRDPACRLVLVGEKKPDPYGNEVSRLVEQAQGGRVSVTGYAPRPVYEHYLAAADLAVQLRTMSRGETSGAVLDCLGWGVPLIANANGSNAEYPADVVRLLKDEFTDEQLVAALEQLKADAEERRRMSAAARSHVARCHEPALVAAQYRDAIEAFAARPQHAPYWNAVAAIGRLGRAHADDLAEAAVALEATWKRSANRSGDTPAPSRAP